MPSPTDFVSHVLDLLAGWGGVSARRMFSGYGLFRSGLMLGLIADDTLYFKVDSRNRGAFEAAGMRPFVYSRKSKTVALSYWEAPSELFDDAEEMIRWARQALDAATASRQKPGRPRKRR
jgi:DNA transformation protein and related proteins